MAPIMDHQASGHHVHERAHGREHQQRSFRHAIAEHVADDEERIDENIAGDSDVDRGRVVQLESLPVENFLERVHRIHRQTDCKNGQYDFEHFDSDGQMAQNFVPFCSRLLTLLGLVRHSDPSMFSFAVAQFGGFFSSI